MQVLRFSEINRIPSNYKLIESGISGGDFEKYLAEMMEKYNRKICLMLQAVRHKFLLPCQDGQGEFLNKQEFLELLSEKEYRYCPALCTNYFYIPNVPAVILFDNENTLQKKKFIAERVGIPYVVEKNKTP